MNDRGIEFAARREGLGTSPFPERWLQRGGLEEARAAGDVANWINRQIEADRAAGLNLVVHSGPPEYRLMTLAEYRALGSRGPCRTCGVVYRSPELNEIGECRTCIYKSQVGKPASPPPAAKPRRRTGKEALQELARLYKSPK